jgi:hypothetical protein
VPQTYVYRCGASNGSREFRLNKIYFDMNSSSIFGNDFTEFWDRAPLLRCINNYQSCINNHSPNKCKWRKKLEENPFTRPMSDPNKVPSVVVEVEGKKIRIPIQWLP